MKMHFLWLSTLALACTVGAQAQVSANSFGRLRIGGRSPVQPGDPTAYPHKVTPQAKFYVLVVAKGLPTMCTFEDCGMEGTLVESLGGWITGDAQNETIHLAGLDQTEVRQGRQSLIVISDQSRRITGIYPNYIMRDLPLILRAHGLMPPAKQ